MRSRRTPDGPRISGGSKDVFIGNWRSARPALRHSRPELAKLPVSPSEHSLQAHENQFRFPMFPGLDSQEQKSRSLFISNGLLDWRL